MESNNANNVNNVLVKTKDEFIRKKLLSDEFLAKLQENRLPLETLIAYYRCANMEIETKFKVLNEQFSLQYDRNPIESIKTRIKSLDSIVKKMRDRDLPFSLESMEKNRMI